MSGIAGGLRPFLMSERGVQVAGLVLSLTFVIVGLVAARLLWGRRAGD